MTLETAALLDGSSGSCRRAPRAATGRRLVSATAEVAALDPCAVAFASRRADDRWFCWEEPDRDGFAIATIGSAIDIVSRGPARFSDLRADTSALIRSRLAAEPDDLPPGAGPLWVGGMAFSEDGRERRRLVVAAAGAADDARGPDRPLGRPPPDHRLRHRRARDRPGERPRPRSAPASPRSASFRCRRSTRRPRGPVEVSSARPPAELRGGGRRRRPEIRSRRGREARARPRGPASPSRRRTRRRRSSGRSARPSAPASASASARPRRAFIGASPELLVRRSGAVAATVALAGSARRSADPAVDDHLGEQLLHSDKDRSEHAIVVRRIERRLAPVSVWVEAAPEPVVIKVANIQHLATPIHAQLAESRSVLELAELLHPTPAVGPEPRGARASG